MTNDAIALLIALTPIICCLGRAWIWAKCHVTVVREHERTERKRIGLNFAERVRVRRSRLSDVTRPPRS